MTGPRSIRGRAVAPSRRQSDFDKGVARACPDCGAQLSRYNDGPTCNQCRADHGTARPHRIRGTITRD